MKSFVHLFKGGRFQRQRLWLPCAQGEIPFLHKAQEGRRNSPVDCFGVGNPRRGFPESRRRRDFVLIFQPGICNSRNEPIPVLQRKDFLHYLREADTGFKKKRLPHTAYAIRCTAADTCPKKTEPIPALHSKDYRTLPTRFGVPAAPRFGARRHAPGICNSRNEPIPALHSKDNHTLPTRFAARRPIPALKKQSRYRPYKVKITAHCLHEIAARRHAPDTCSKTQSRYRP